MPTGTYLSIWETKNSIIELPFPSRGSHIIQTNATLPTISIWLKYSQNPLKRTEVPNNSRELPDQFLEKQLQKLFKMAYWTLKQLHPNKAILVTFHSGVSPGTALRGATKVGLKAHPRWKIFRRPLHIKLRFQRATFSTSGQCYSKPVPLSPKLGDGFWSQTGPQEDLHSCIHNLGWLPNLRLWNWSKVVPSR